MSFEFHDASLTIPERVRQLAGQQPEAPALRCDGELIDWRTLCRSSRAVAAHLQHLRLQAGQRVGLLAEPNARYLECFLAIVTAGGCAVTFPTASNDEVLTRFLLDAGCTMILVDSSWWARFHRLRDRLPHPPTAIPLDFDDASTATYVYWRMLDEQELIRPVGPDVDFNIVYSSGTTATPKGILHTHATRARMAAGMAELGAGPDSVTMIATALYTNLSLPAFLSALWRGGQVVVQPKFDAGEYLVLATTLRATHHFLVPSQVRRLLEDPGFSQADLSSSKLVYVGGSRWPVESKAAMRNRWPGRVLEAYGMTEGAPVSAHWLDDVTCPLESVGRPIGELRVISEIGEELPPGNVGEFVGRTMAMMKGYLNHDDLTEALIWRDGAGQRFFRSGDLGYVDEQGCVHIVDRRKDVIISGGFNIYASDIEAVLLGHSDIADAAVVAIPDERWGETPLAVVVSRGEVDSEQVRSWLNARVTKHQRVAAVEVVDMLPRNALGKVLKRELRDRWLTRGSSAQPVES
jgi:long-chain acyl-CoA synthetase